jgi:hypothetical protein
MRANKPRPAGDEDAHEVPFCFCVIEFGG